MSDEPGAAHLRRARLVARVALAIGLAPALFFLWNLIGLSGIPGIDFGSSGAQADPGLVVRIADMPRPRAYAHSLVASTGAAPGQRPRAQHSAGAAPSPTRALAPAANGANLPHVRTPGALSTIDVIAPAAPAHSAPATAPPLEAPSAETTPPAALPALPPLPTVQVPTVSIPPVAPPVPLASALPVPAVVNAIVGP